MSTQSVSPALRAAVDASLSWYDALCGLHGVPCGIEDDVWSAYAPPPPLHSIAKTVEPGARPDRALAAVAGNGSIADSFGSFDLTGDGYRLLFEAQWMHQPAPTVGTRRLPAGWSSVGTESELHAWTSEHDTQAVLLPSVLQRSAFRVMARRGRDGYEAGAVLHLCTGVVALSNVWSTSEGLAGATWSPPRPRCSQDERSSATSTVRTSSPRGSRFTMLGPQRVWVR